VVRAHKHTLYPVPFISADQCQSVAAASLKREKIMADIQSSSSPEHTPNEQHITNSWSQAKHTDQYTLDDKPIIQNNALLFQGPNLGFETIRLIDSRPYPPSQNKIQPETDSSRKREVQKIHISPNDDLEIHGYASAADRLVVDPDCVQEGADSRQVQYNQAQKLADVELEKCWSPVNDADLTQSGTDVVGGTCTKPTSNVSNSVFISDPAINFQETLEVDDIVLLHQPIQDSGFLGESEIAQHLPVTSGLYSWQGSVLNIMQRLLICIDSSDTSFTAVDNIIPMYQTMRTLFEKAGPLLTTQLTFQIAHSLIKSRHLDLTLWFLKQEGINRDILYLQDDLFQDSSRLLRSLEHLETMMEEEKLNHGKKLHLNGVAPSRIELVDDDYTGKLISKIQASPDPQDLLSLWNGSREFLLDMYDQNPNTDALFVFQVFFLRSADFDLGGEQAWTEGGCTPLLCACMEIAHFVQTSIGLTTLFVPLQRVLRRWVDRYRPYNLFEAAQVSKSNTHRNEGILVTYGDKTTKVLRLKPNRTEPRKFLCHETSERVSSAAIPYLESFLDAFPRDYVEHMLETLLMQLVGPESELFNMGFNPEHREKWFPEHLLWMFVRIADQWDFKTCETLFALQGATSVNLDHVSAYKVYDSPIHDMATISPVTQLSPFRGFRRSIEHLVMMRRRSTYVDYLRKGSPGGSITRIAMFFLINWVRHRGRYEIQSQSMKHLVEREMLIQSKKLLENIMSRKEYYTAHPGATLYSITHIIKNLKIEGLKEISQDTIDLVMTDLIIILLEYGKIEELMSMLEFYRLNGHELCWPAVRKLLRLEDTHPKEFEYILLRHLKHYPDVLQNIISVSADVDPAKAQRIYHILTRIHHRTPTKNLLVNMARKYAISDQLSPRQALRRVLGVVNVSRRLGYPPDVRMGEALTWAMVMRRTDKKLKNGEVPDKAGSVRAGFKRLRNIAIADDRMVTDAANSGRVTGFLMDKVRNMKEESNKDAGDDRGPYDEEMQKWILANKELTPDRDKVSLFGGKEEGGTRVEVTYARNRAAGLAKEMHEEIDRVVGLYWKKKR